MSPARTDQVSQSRLTLDPGDLSFRLFQVFVAVLETGSVNRAAQRLSLSPSTVSQQLTNLEALTGTSLFDRSARPIVLTVAGSILKPHAYKILDALGEARADLMSMNLSSLTELRLGVIDELDTSVTPELVQHLRTQYPGCLFPAISRRSDMLSEDLQNRNLDVIVSGLVPDDPSTFERWPILRETFVVVSAKDVLPREITRADLEALPFVHFNRNLPIGRLIAQHMNRLKMQPPEQFSFDASRAVFAMVQRIGGWALCNPLSILASERYWHELDIHPTPFPGISRSIALAARSGETAGLPQRLTSVCRNMVRRSVVPRAQALMPQCGPVLQILDDAGEVEKLDQELDG